MPSLPSVRFNRRTLGMLASSFGACALASPLLGVDPFRRSVPGQLRLSLAAYSLRDLLTKPESGWDLFKFVDYCFDQGIPGAELTSYYFPAEVTPAYLIELKQYCHRKGITISGGAIRNDFCQSDDAKIRDDIEQAKVWIDRYAILGAPVIRIFAGNQPSGDSWENTIARCVKATETLARYAESKGVYLGVENHGGVTAKASGLLEIVNQVQSTSVGINFDCGNFRSEDPYAELAMIAPYAVNAQIKVDIYPNNQHQGTDLARVVSILRDAGYSGWIALEYESKEDPLVAIPKWLSQLKKLVS